MKASLKFFILMKVLLEILQFKSTGLLQCFNILLCRHFNIDKFLLAQPIMDFGVLGPSGG